MPGSRMPSVQQRACTERRHKQAGKRHGWQAAFLCLALPADSGRSHHCGGGDRVYVAPMAGQQTSNGRARRQLQATKQRRRQATMQTSRQRQQLMGLVAAWLMRVAAGTGLASPATAAAASGQTQLSRQQSGVTEFERFNRQQLFTVLSTALPPTCIRPWQIPSPILPKYVFLTACFERFHCLLGMHLARDVQRRTKPSMLLRGMGQGRRERRGGA